ncbi:hypothetical protein POTOM_059974 [Populus tomentosa]|uniref:Uncharacterized protein n=1 Tax=Populus tomentosa TaxID=118781 RepID=A0A8X7XS59_POPTO|nr:hypothetical protein POTOM_059974 [Populus tomentosa]
MVRTRLAWFTVGFSVSAAAISQFAWRDLFKQRYALSYQMNQQFEDLEARVLNLESFSPQNSNQTTQWKPTSWIRFGFNLRAYTIFLPILIASRKDDDDDFDVDGRKFD